MDANRVIDIFMSMDRYERDRAFGHAMADGDRRRARIAAFTPIPSNWPELHRAIWLARRKQLDIDVATTRPPANDAHGYPGRGQTVGMAPEEFWKLQEVLAKQT